MPRTPADVEAAIALTRKEDFLRALTLFMEIYGTEDSPPIQSARDASGLSYFGLCLAVMQRKFKVAIDLCRRAMDLEFYNADHFANLARVYMLAGNRRKAIETCEAGFKLAPENDALLQVRKVIGVRARPAVPFLDRSHPINVSLGQARHAKKVAEEEQPKKKR